MSLSLNELLQPQVILKVISRLRNLPGRLAPWLGWLPKTYNDETSTLDGPNIIRGDVRYATFRIFDHTRVVAKARAPGTGPATVARNPVGEVKIACARFHEKIPLDTEQLSNLSPLIGPNSQIDPGGANYIQKQTRFIATQFHNAIELMASGMMQNNLYFQQQGDNWLPVIGNPGGTSFKVDFQVPAGNLNQLNLLGVGNIITVPWNNIAAPIFSNLMTIKAAFALLSGYVVQHAWINSTMWRNIVINSEIRNLAGSANTPFAEYDLSPERGPDGEPTGGYEAILRADPTITWHLYDNAMVTGSDIDPSYSTAPSTAVLQKMVPDNMVFISPTPSPDWTEMYHGGEYVVENPGQPMILRRGYWFWKEWTTQPGGIDLIGLLNAVPLLYVPKATAAAAAIF